MAIYPPLSSFPTRIANGGLNPDGIFIGIVRRVDADSSKVWVLLPRLDPEAEFGPVLVGTDSFLAVNDRVICAFLEGATDIIVILGRMGGIGGGRSPDNGISAMDVMQIHP